MGLRCVVGKYSLFYESIKTGNRYIMHVCTYYIRVCNKFEAKRSHLLFVEIFMENKHVKCGAVRCTMSVENKYIIDLISRILIFRQISNFEVIVKEYSSFP